MCGKLWVGVLAAEHLSAWYCDSGPCGCTVGSGKTIIWWRLPEGSYDVKFSRMSFGALLCQCVSRLGALTRGQLCRWVVRSAFSSTCCPLPAGIRADDHKIPLKIRRWCLVLEEVSRAGATIRWLCCVIQSWRWRARALGIRLCDWSGIHGASELVCFLVLTKDMCSLLPLHQCVPPHPGVDLDR